MTVAHLLDIFFKKTYVKEASKNWSFLRLLIYLSKPCCDGGLCSNKCFSSFSIECAKAYFPLKDRLSTILKSIFFPLMREKQAPGVTTWISSTVNRCILHPCPNYCCISALYHTFRHWSDFQALSPVSQCCCPRVLPSWIWVKFSQAPEAVESDWSQCFLENWPGHFNERGVLVVYSSAQMKPSGTERVFAIGSIFQSRGCSANPVWKPKLLLQWKPAQGK